MSNPSIFTELMSLSSAVMSQVAAGCPASDEEERSRRSAICAECPSLNKEEFRCNECGCYLKYKIMWKTQNCPLGKWGK